MRFGAFLNNLGTCSAHVSVLFGTILAYFLHESFGAFFVHLGFMFGKSLVRFWLFFRIVGTFGGTFLAHFLHFGQFWH